MSRKDNRFKYVSGKNFASVDTGGGTVTSTTRLPPSQSSEDGTGRRSLDGLLPGLSPSVAHLAEETKKSWLHRRISSVKRTESDVGHRVRSAPGKRQSEARSDPVPDPAPSSDQPPEPATSGSRTVRQDSVELVWSEESYSVSDVIDELADELPVIVKVVRGYTSGGDRILYVLPNEVE